MSEKTEFGGWWLWITALMILSGALLFAANSFGLIGRTIVEREVFKNSYQKQAGDLAKQKLFKAKRIMLQQQLLRDDLSLTQRADYQAQLNAIKIQGMKE